MALTNYYQKGSMMLKEQTIFGLVNKVDLAIRRIKLHESSEGYYVAFSGGKDSCVILDLIKRAGVKFDAHLNITTVDPPEVIRFVRQQYPEVAMEKPEMSMKKLIEQKGILPTRLARYCCAEYKERGGIGRYVVTGVRRAESARRATRHFNCLILLHSIDDVHHSSSANFLGKVTTAGTDSICNTLTKPIYDSRQLLDTGT